MNYAKEAYMLSTELAARGYPSVYGDVFSDLGSGGDLATLPAGALVCVTAQLTGGGSAEVRIGGAAAAALDVPGTSTAVFAAPEGGTVSVHADGAEFARVLLTTLGSGAPVRAYYSASLRADSHGGEVLALAVGGDTVVYSSSGGAFAEIARLGACDDADVCAEGRIVAFTSDGSAYVRALGSESGSVYLGKGKRIAVCRDGEGYAAAVFDGTKVTVFMLADDLTPLRSASCHGSPTVEALAFAKGAENAALVVSDGGRNLLRRVSHGGDAASCAAYVFKEGG